jgi:hypothetical protein
MFIQKITLNIFLLCIVATTLAQQNSNAYDFPIKPGMEEWKSFKSHEEMLKALQLPTNVIKSISTEGLMYTCLNYPMFVDVWFSRDIRIGFEWLKKDFNGFNEFLNRKDSFNILFKYYQEMDPEKVVDKNTLIEKGKFTGEICKVEIILTQPELLQNITFDEKKSLLQEAEIKYQKMLGHKEFDIRSLTSNAYLIGNILDILDNSIKENKKINNFINTSRIYGQNTIREIHVLANNYLINQ